MLDFSPENSNTKYNMKIMLDISKISCYSYVYEQTSSQNPHSSSLHALRGVVHAVGFEGG